MTGKLRVALGAALIVALAVTIALLGASAKSGRGLHAPFAMKGDPDALAMNKAAVPGPENRNPDLFTAEGQDAMERAYPATSVPMSAIIDSQQSFNKVRDRSRNDRASWELIGPSEATYPAVLNQFLADGAESVASGRTNAVALTPGCGDDGHGHDNNGHDNKSEDASRGGHDDGHDDDGDHDNERSCRLFIAAAGGGIWRADNALSKHPHWKFLSGSFGTNAIGTMLIDPNDKSGRTILAGTGEPNASGDSEAGLGIYRSSNGGDSWKLLPGSAQFQGRSLSELQIAPNGNIIVGVARGVRGISSVTGGGTSNPPPPVAPLGLYRSTDGGATFTSIWNGAGSIRGVNGVGIDPNTPTTLYASAFQFGVWRSLDNGVTWTQIKPALNPGFNTDRAEFALNKLPGGKTRMYVGIGASGGAIPARFFRTDDAAGAAVFTDTTTPQVGNYCTAQCWYDNIVYSPPGFPDVVYALGSYDYDHIGTTTNGRAVLLSTDAGVTWSDMTRDSDTPHRNAIHPDQHALTTVPGKPYLFFNGSDGGVVRTDGELADTSADCDARGLSAAGVTSCKALLSRVPRRIFSLNRGLSTLQFQSLSASFQRPTRLVQGGTQDNGTFVFTGDEDVWMQEIYGDGGQSGFSATNDDLRFNTFTGQASDVNFQGGDPTKWVIATGPIVSSPEGAFFYPPVTGDPNPANAQTIYQGSQSVWRTQDWGGPQAFLEANCPEFTTSAANPACGDFVRLGAPGSTDLTGAAYGADRQSVPAAGTGLVSAIERAPSDTGTVWAATGAGRVFISKNGGDAPAATVLWTRIDTSSTVDPGRFVSSIYVDPKDPNHAWLSYSGYNFNTPTAPGHVFEVTYNAVSGTATWTNFDGGLGPQGDLPVTDLVRDSDGTLYASTDFGVMKYSGGTWSVAGANLPMVEVAGLTISPGRVLYAATHGRSAWKLKLG